MTGEAGGAPIVTGTRIPVWLLEQARRLGMSEHEQLRAYPTLCGADLAADWAYASEHREEIDSQIAENETDVE